MSVGRIGLAPLSVGSVGTIRASPSVPVSRTMIRLLTVLGVIRVSRGTVGDGHSVRRQNDRVRFGQALGEPAAQWTELVSQACDPNGRSLIIHVQPDYDHMSFQAQNDRDGSG